MNGVCVCISDQICHISDICPTLSITSAHLAHLDQVILKIMSSRVKASFYPVGNRVLIS